MSPNESHPADEKSKRRWLQATLRLLLIVAVAVAILLGLGSAAWHFTIKVAARAHMKSVTRSLAEWAVEDSQIHSNQDAFHAIDMLSYIEHYYVPGDGYRSDAETEAALQAQRKRTTDTIIESLERFTGEHFGDDFKKWELWRQNRQMSSLPNPPHPQGASPLSSVELKPAVK